MTLYAFKYQDDFLDLFDQQAVTFSEDNPLLSTEEVFPNTNSFSISFPWSHTNRKAFGDVADYQQQIDTKEIDVELWLFGQPYCTGKLTVTKASADKVDTQFLEISYKDHFDDITLNELDFESYDISVGEYDYTAPLPEFFNELTTRNMSFNSKIPNKDFVAPTIYNPAAIGIAEYDLQALPSSASIKSSTPFQNLYLGAWDTYFAQAEWIRNAGDPNPGVPAGARAWVYPINPITPMCFATHIITKIFDFLNLQVDENSILNSPLHNLIIYSNRAVILYNKEKWWMPGNSTESVEPSFNYYTVRPYESKIDIKDYVPHCSISKFLSAMSKTFNIAFIPNRAGAVDIINRSDAVHFMPELDISKNTSLDGSIEFAKVQQVNKIIWPDLFDEEVNKEFNFKGNLELISDLPEDGNRANDAYYILEDKTLYTFSLVESQFIALAENNTNNPLNFQTEIEGVEIKPDAQPASHSSLYPYEVKWKYGGLENLGLDPSSGEFSRVFHAPKVTMPLATQKSAYNLKPSENTVTDEIVFLLYRGFWSNPNGHYYPYASTTSEVPGMPEQAFPDTLNMFGPGGIYETYWRKWNETIKVDRKTTVNINPNLTLYQKLFTSKLRIGNQLFIAKNKSLKLTPHKIESCQVELYQIKI